MVGDLFDMDNPFNGSCAGIVVGVNCFFEDAEFHKHGWQIFERGTKPYAGSYGSAIRMNMDGL